jgi:cytochrome c553
MAAQPPFLLFLILLAAALAAPSDESASGAEFFEKHVRPILAAKCYACHNVNSANAGLRLNSIAGLRQGGRSGPLWSPGKPDASLLMAVLSHSHSKLKMPPGGKLPDEEIQTVRRWIEIGAPLPAQDAAAHSTATAYWAFRPLAPPPVPSVPGVSSPIDAFLLDKLRRKGLAPAPPAGRRELVRRLYFDLLGLPPKPEEVEAFVLETAPDAWPRLVERLLASPHYGERWARHWLDLVRYAETNGHEFDNDKLDAWRYRDYVIRAFNEDLPYDQFVREHIAGDLLPQKRLSRDGAFFESPLGTSFFWFGEVLNSAVDSVKSRADEVDNQLDVFGKAFLGLTIACARCHDHKFDPIATRDYYSLSGFFHSTTMREAVIDSPDRVAQIQDLRRKIAAVNQQIANLLRSWPRPYQQRAALTLRSEDSLFDDFSKTDFLGWMVSGQAFSAGPEASVPPNQPLSGAYSAGLANSFAEGSNKFVGSLTSKKFTPTKLFLHVRLAGSKNPEELKGEKAPLRFTVVADGFKSLHILPDGSGVLKWKTLRLTKEINRSCYLEIVDRSREGHIVVDAIVLSDSPNPPEPAPETSIPAQALEDSLSRAGTNLLEQLRQLQLERSLLDEQIPESTFGMIAADEDPRDVRIHIRGDHKNLGDVAPRRMLPVLANAEPPLIAPHSSGRLELARALTSAPAAPLLARVMVNRIWKHHFGRGLVKSTDNFGRMGDEPSHPELLDWLAHYFIQHNWSVKALHRLILTSQAYQMSDRALKPALEVDPENTLLHHYRPQKLEAEAIRDAILAVAGTLDLTLYGPSVPPYISPWQDGRGKPLSGPLDGNRRRSIYIQIRRNFLPSMFLTFDYPLPITTIGSRSISTVPSQALFLMNNEFVRQQARAWAARLMKDIPSARARIDRMFLQAFARPPEAAELEASLAFLDRQSALYGTDDKDLCALADLAHVLFNSPEFFYVR